jgi:hypothetical protein
VELGCGQTDCGAQMQLSGETFAGKSKKMKAKRLEFLSLVFPNH